jgi:CubicO group peptidase (beta-lactamase class C family)
MFYRYFLRVASIFTMMSLIFVSFASYNLVFASNLQQADYASRLNAFLLTQMETYKIPGMAVAVVRNGDVEYINGFGVANPDGDPVTPDTPFLLASVSKSFTALGVMQLVEEGKINLDDPVQKYIPWFEVKGEGSAEITVAHLVYQTSGFSEYDGSQMNLRPNTPDELRQRSEIWAEPLCSSNRAKAGNTEYQLQFAWVLIQASGQSYESILSKIFLPHWG